MKNAKTAFILIAGFMMSLFAGCFNPVSLTPSNTQVKNNQETGDSRPFTVDVYVGHGSRSITGATSTQIRGLYNFMQLVVVDASGRIVAYADARKNKSTDQSAVLEIDELPYGETYKFLLLFGNWEREVFKDKTDSENGVILGYHDNTNPVLLAAGYKSQVLTGIGKVNITMWPLAVDTVFEAADMTRAVPAIGGVSDLLQSKSWKVKWNIGKNVFKSLLEAHSASELPVAAKKYIVDEAEKSALTNVTTLNTLEHSLDGYTAFTDIGTPHTVNFCLEYVPFAKTSIADWSPHNNKSEFFDFTHSVPKWNIRNGLNNLRQDGYTDFSKAGNPEAADYTAYNGNGGVTFKAREDYSSALILSDGMFMGPLGSQNVKIGFKTAGYTGGAALYYRIIPAGGIYNDKNPLPYNMFTEILGSYNPGTYSNAALTLPSTISQDIWLMFMKDGKVSNRMAINTGAVSNPSYPYEDGYYVSAKGNDANPGSFYSPFKTLNKGVNAASGNNKPVIVIGPLTSENSGIINNTSTFAIFRSVTVKGHPSSNAALTAAAGKRVLVSAGPDVILRNITLRNGNGQAQGTGIYIESGTLTLKQGGAVTENGHKSTRQGGGVFVNRGATFVLDGGIISHNWTGTDTLNGGGGGVYINGTASFKSGIIANNWSCNDGGGVVVGGEKVKGRWSGVLYMYAGTEVSNNEAKDDGGGIKVDYEGRFYMYGGAVKNNTCAHYGGGLRLESGSIYIYDGVLITGKDRADANIAGSGGHAYTRYGPKKHDYTITNAFTDSY
jgi:hypothetical protein